MIKSSDELAELESQMWSYVINNSLHSSEEVLYIAVSKPSSQFGHASISVFIANV